MKKIELIEKKEGEQSTEKVNYSVPAWYRVIDNQDVIILSSGEHTEDCFTGMCLPCPYYPNGRFGINWAKEHTKRMEEILTIKISN